MWQHLLDERHLPWCMRNTLRLAALVVGVRRASSMAALASKPDLTFVTGNAKKLEEVTAILNAGTPLPFAIGMGFVALMGLGLNASITEEDRKSSAYHKQFVLNDRKGDH